MLSDKTVPSRGRVRGIPVIVTYAGGYARSVEDAVTIHSDTVVTAKEVFGPITG